MRYFILLLSLGLLIPQESYPPELQPIPAPERFLRVLGFPVAEDEPIEFTQGDVIYADIIVALAVGVSSGVCQRGIDRINLTASNSGVATAQTRLVSCFPTTYISSGSAATDLNRLYLPSDGFLDEVRVERDSVFADIMLLIGKSGDSCGVAVLNAGQFSAVAYANDGCESNSSIEHEIGHIFGMAHDLPNAGNLAYPYGVGWCVLAGLFRTVEAYPSPCGGNRIPHYSNPDILYQGIPTGTATANNSRVLRDRIAVVAGFRVRPETTNHGR